jgi:hypothetical protein
MKSGRPVGYGRVAGEQADGATDWFSGRREGRGSPKSFSVAEKRRWQARVGVTGGIRAVGEEVLGGAVLGVGSRRLEVGWSGLSAVARVGRRGTAAVVRTQGRRRQLAGRRGSGRWWGPRGGENHGERWPKMATVDEATSVETVHDVGWLRGLFTAAGSR